GMAACRASATILGSVSRMRGRSAAGNPSSMSSANASARTRLNLAMKSARLAGANSRERSGRIIHSPLAMHERGTFTHRDQIVMLVVGAVDECDDPLAGTGRAESLV